MTILDYLDSSVLISGSTENPLYAEKLLELLSETNRKFVASGWLRLEVLPKPTHNKQMYSVLFLETYFATCTLEISFSTELVQSAYDLACIYGLSGFDALHIASAIEAKASEFITVEKRTKPMYKIQELTVIHLLDI